ncbi:MAG: TetR/AcrR family transcriptional regulator, partial [Actinobacteria bacterium]|nr:TetR/AcrR family transcriptional regulator [Actinomycetota bacterium]
MTATPPEVERHDAIAVAAARCFQRWGVGRTRMEDVAREAGITRPALYRYYGGKDALLHEVIVRHIRERSDELHGRLPAQGPVGPLLVEAVLSGIFGPRTDDDGLTAAILDVDVLHDTARLVAESG